jgi:hypothetical protein
MPKPPRVPRDLNNLLAALERHLSLLREYSERAFRKGDASFYGEVAGKLRVLVYEKGRNKPLLLALIREFNLEIPVTINKPRGNIQMTLEEYLDSLAVAIRTPSSGMVSVSKRDFIAIWAQQYGASHEDWEINEELAEALGSGMFIGQMPIAAAALRGIANTVLWVGEKFLTQVKNVAP